jgi:hypothetical protein
VTRHDSVFKVGSPRALLKVTASSSAETNVSSANIRVYTKLICLRTNSRSPIFVSSKRRSLIFYEIAPKN